MKQLKEFMLLFRYQPKSHALSDQQLSEMHQQWSDFIGGIAIQGKLVSSHQLGFEGKKISSDKTVNDGLYVLEGQTLGGNMVLKAESLHSATELAKKCPILLMGGNVEVRNILPMN